MNRFRPHALAHVLTLALALPVPFVLATPALAQSSRNVQAAPSITGFDVQALERLEPGADLAFTLWGTPGASASLRIDGAQRTLTLSETSPGVYQGTYTVSSRDRLQPDGHVTANLRRGNQVASALLGEPLQAGWQTPQAASAAAPQIARFSVEQTAPRSRVLNFKLEGTAGGKASVRLPGAQERLMLDETTPGIYNAAYSIKAGDRIDVNQPVTARLRVGDRSTTTTLDRALDASRLPLQAVSAVNCATTCGTVVAINRVEVKGEGSLLGTLGGGALGAVLGNQVGKGSGRTAATVLGAVGGAVVGRQVEKSANKRDHFEVVVRLDSGVQQTVSYADSPPLKVGDVVRVSDGTLLLGRS